jgi:hypothetical protein
MRAAQLPSLPNELPGLEFRFRLHARISTPRLYRADAGAGAHFASPSTNMWASQVRVRL